MNGTLGVTCPATGQTFMLESRGHLNLYAGMRQDPIQPMITAVNTIYPIQQPYENYYSLQIQQRIIGVNNADLLGLIQSVIQVTQEAPMIKVRHLLSFQIHKIII